MNVNFYIAKRITHFRSSEKQFSKPVARVALVGISMGLAVMIITMSVVAGFKREIRNKIFGFGSHIQIINYDNNNSYETEPILTGSVDTAFIAKVSGVQHVQPFCTKAGIIKTKGQAQGIVLKGIDQHFDWAFFNENMTAGSSFSLEDTVKSDDIVISQTIASMLEVEVGDKLTLYFIEQPPRFRRFTISGIYQTHMAEFDKMFALCDMRHIQKLNNWDERMITGYEVSVNDFGRIEEMRNAVLEHTGSFIGADGSRLKVQTIMEKYPYIFDWIGLFNTNLWVIFILLTLVTGFNMISGLLVIILERTSMIGILKAMGYNNASIQKIFLYHSLFLIRNGLFWGNAAGLIIVFIQYYFRIFTLDQQSYYIEYVPVFLNPLHFVLLNTGYIAVVFIMLLLPSYIISRISPDKAIKFN
jgi:lipoprotein-releasing system permease protein